jgi:iron(III) transport system permease protein
MGVRDRPTRWIYGLPGVWLAQTLALTPVAYLVLVGVVDGISPSLEEAAQTLRASPWTRSPRSRCR